MDNFWYSNCNLTSKNISTAVLIKKFLGSGLGEGASPYPDPSPVSFIAENNKVMKQPQRTKFVNKPSNRW